MMYGSCLKTSSTVIFLQASSLKRSDLLETSRTHYLRPGHNDTTRRLPQLLHYNCFQADSAHARASWSLKMPPAHSVLGKCSGSKAILSKGLRLPKIR